MDIILIPGLWLDGSSWDDVVPYLERAGHRARALTLPGMQSQDADRSQVSLRDHVDAVVAAIDDVDPAEGKAVLVGHSHGGVIAYAASDQRPDRIARLVYVGSEPHVADGPPDEDAGMGLTADSGEVALPDWSWSTTRWWPTSTTPSARRCANVRSRRLPRRPTRRMTCPTTDASMFRRP